MAGVQAAVEMLFVSLWVPPDLPAKLFLGGQAHLGAVGALFCNSVDLVHIMPLAMLREFRGWGFCPSGAWSELELVEKRWGEVGGAA